MPGPSQNASTDADPGDERAAHDDRERPALRTDPPSPHGAALRRTGLPAAPDPGMDRFARLTADALDVPTALVTLLTSSEPARRIVAGLAGPADPWAGPRRARPPYPPAHTEPLLLHDARNDPRTEADPALAALGTAGFASLPLTDADGHLLGALSALDTRPRRWTARDRALLTDLAAACATELRLRLHAASRDTAEPTLRDDEIRARSEANAMAARYRNALDRSQVLLRAADALADTTGLEQVRRQVHDLVTSDLKPVHVDLLLTYDGHLHRLIDPLEAADGTTPAPTDGSGPVKNDTAVTYAPDTYPLDSSWPVARAARENRTIVVHGPPDLADADRHIADTAAPDAYRRTGLATAACVPLPGAEIPLGVLVLGWDEVHEIDIVEQAVLASLAGYTARAVERALFVDNRVHAARQMQEAMLTDLPSVAGLELAALYRPAEETDLVGGDWYDAYPLPGPGQDARVPADAAVVALTIGDITGHDLHAATLMGQVRSMLRQADFDHPGTGPARVVTAVEHANTQLRIGASGTLVHAHLRPCPTTDGDGWELTWTNAGHPAPLAVTPDGAVHRLDAGGMLLHSGLGPRPRTAHRFVLPPGTLLFLYTDGLVEQRGGDIDAAIDATGRLLTGHSGQPLPALLSTVADRIAGAAREDDIALLAVRVPSGDAPPRP